MKYLFIRFTWVVLASAAIFSARAGSDPSAPAVIAPAGPSLLSVESGSTTEPAYLSNFAPSESGASDASPDDLGNYPLSGPGSVAASPARIAASLSAGGGPKAAVPAPEPSSETSLYVLSGLVGLAFVVLRRRKLA